jgi:hypothetical protein
MMNRFRGKVVFANLLQRNVVTLASPTITSSLESGSSTARLYSVTVVVPPTAGINSTGLRVSTVWRYYMSGDSDGFLPAASANFTFSTQGAQGGIFPDSTINVSRGFIVTNSTGHAIVAFSASTAVSTNFFNLIRPDGQRVASVSMALT